MMFCPAMEFLWLSLWFWSKMDKRAFLLSLLKRFDFILSEVIFSLCCVDKSIMVLSQLIMVTSESINFTLALVVGLEKSLECVPQLCVETGASIECGGKVSFHCVCLICLLVY